MSKKNKKRGVILYIIIFIALALLHSNFSYAKALITDSYEISVDSINERIKIENYRDYPITIKNKESATVDMYVTLSSNMTDLAWISRNSISVPPNSQGIINMTFFADKLGAFSGSVNIAGDINEEIPIQLLVSETIGTPVEALTLEVSAIKNRVYIGEPFRFKVDLQNLLAGEKYNISMHYAIEKFKPKSSDLNKTLFKKTESVIVDSSVTIIKDIELPENIKTDEYILNFTADYLGLSSNTKVRFFVNKRFLDRKILGLIQVRTFLQVLTGLGVLVGGFILLRRYKKKKKRYKSDIDFNLLPKSGPRSVRIGKIAETSKNAYFEIDQLTIHTLIAGSTGGGKTVSAEVLIEECLQKDATVFVFDPTAQWSGFLRKCTNKKFLDLYAGFGMKKSEAKAFNGNVHQILNARQIIDIKKYMVPGEIHVFATNRLDPKDMDILVANTIRGVFRANLPEAGELKLMIIFDEVHRLLPKFGGSGQGFVQIERGAREFRKWGVGLMLISQVLTDFIGSTKANINTEIQMRTRDQGDLERIKNKYGGFMLQSLLKSATGTGMIENSAYNKGNPYFVTFRPLLHEHARLSDEELDNYNKYNDVIDELEFQIQQLEEEKLDVFDFKLELKMALDKVKSGSFNMVDIYLEGLKPRLEEAWGKLGKTPKKLQTKLVSEEELAEDFELAKKAREEMGLGEMAEPSKAKKEMPELELKGGVTVKGVMELIDSVNTMELADALEQKEVMADYIKDVNAAAAEELKTADTLEKMIIALEKAQ